jgi:hypothetical protein
MVQYLELWNAISGIHLQDDVVDSFEWTWTPRKGFSAKSAYVAFLEGRTF